jgi:hypothetical protein
MSVVLPPNSTGTQLETFLQGASSITYNTGEKQVVALSDGGKATYSACYTAQSAGTSATTEIAYIAGSATKTIRVLGIILTGTQATAGQEYDLTIQKEAALPTGGTKATAATIVPWDSNSAAASATTAFYTATPTASASITGVVAVKKYSFFIATATTVQPPYIPAEFWFGTLPGGSAVVLRGAAQCLAVTLAAATPGNANSIDVTFIWTEE